MSRRSLFDSMSTNILLIRADANAEIGTGHVMRCVALAQAWRDSGGGVTFILGPGGVEIHERLLSEGFEISEVAGESGGAEDAAQTSELCVRKAAEWLVLDGYHFSQDYRDRIRSAPSHLLLVDDHGAFAPYNCDVVLNTNVYASEAIYPARHSETHFLLGSAYALLRREFLSRRRPRADEPEQATQLLITLGGADPHNVTLTVVEALGEIDDRELDLTVVLGASNRHRASVERALNRTSHPFRLLLNVSNMPELMARSDLAISAGGGTCDELAFLRVPMFLITIAKNQEQAVEAYRRKNAAVTAGWFTVFDRAGLARSLRDVIGNRDLRRGISENAGALVDGRGAQRVVENMGLVGAVGARRE
jgi:UDP-2,4-diacetamido-2,4,6-trideoxy-beta-L-altropyranose hydrolase